ncbi:hypothetical protein BO70DRAFT_214973 [Aspergillus heteromorphus CBS 117.55]|uniref:Uncharacterized protein n=1 Tax=Aspergillus heteromorphus CBS 117.55 TaxID=1448321 RepID=A0A317WKR6_9EURO|nr:uncharacterized protein BO70DRAFT_214973 [Aspergillus heteromorphus CBS 117.55]PWY86973.1 hypothetical protein BO70DRAFT_214973 [Aspergillus heteromorphus CBS 117.55]
MKNAWGPWTCPAAVLVDLVGAEQSGQVLRRFGADGHFSLLNCARRRSPINGPAAESLISGASFWPSLVGSASWTWHYSSCSRWLSQNRKNERAGRQAPPPATTIPAGLFLPLPPSTLHPPPPSPLPPPSHIGTVDDHPLSIVGR